MSGYKRKRGGVPGEDYGMGRSGSGVYGPYRKPLKRVYKSRRAYPAARRTAGMGELKFHDVDLDDAVIAAGGQVTATINIIPQGVTEVQRIGRKCTIKSINWKYIYFMPEAADVADPTIPDSFRLIMYIDKQANGATAAVTDILETNDFQSFRNLANSGRFDILCDKYLTLNYRVMASETAGQVSMGACQASGSFYKKCDIPIEFSAAAGTIDEIRSNNIGVMLVGQVGSIGFASKIRLRFSDN